MVLMEPLATHTLGSTTCACAIVAWGSTSAARTAMTPWRRVGVRQTTNRGTERPTFRAGGLPASKHHGPLKTGSQWLSLLVSLVHTSSAPVRHSYPDSHALRNLSRDRILYRSRNLMRLAVVLALALATSAHAADIVRTPRGEAIDRYMAQLAAFGISGALYVAQDGETIVQKGYGVANRATGARVTADDAFLIARCPSSSRLRASWRWKRMASCACPIRWRAGFRTRRQDARDHARPADVAHVGTAVHEPALAVRDAARATQ
jgi:hypothetical protein